MPQFDSRLKRTQKISPVQIREAKLVEKMGLETGLVYGGKKGGTRTILRIIYPIFIENKHTTIIKRFPDGNYLYNTPDAFGTSCHINFVDEKGKDDNCSPSEFQSWMNPDMGPVAKNEEHGAYYIDKVDKPTLNFINRQAKMNKDIEIMPGEKLPSGD